jgi:uroporphyrinogen-III synthase
MKTILVIRTFDDFSRILNENDFAVINLPLIETKTLNDLSEFDAKLDQIGIYDAVFLTSAKAAEVFRLRLIEKKIDVPGKVYVLGKRGHETLKGANLDLRFDEAANTAREMLVNIGFEELNNKRILFIRGEKSLRIVPEFLTNIASVEESIVYETVDVTVGADVLSNLREKLYRAEIAATCFFSPSAAKGFIEQFGAETADQTIIAAIGKTTAEYFELQNVKVGFVSSKSNAENFAVELIKYLTNGKWKMENGK